MAADTPKVTLKNAIAALSDAIPNVLDRYEEAQQHIAELCRFYRQLREANSQIENLCKILNQLEQELSYNVIPEHMENMKIDRISSGGYTYSLGVRTNANIPAAMKEKGLQWLKENGFSALVHENVNAKTLSSAVSSYTQETGLIPPEDAITIHRQKYISVRKS